jgi:hypothetical protein
LRLGRNLAGNVERHGVAPVFVSISRKRKRDVRKRPVEADVGERQRAVRAQLRVLEAIRRGDDLAELRAFGADAAER